MKAADSQEHFAKLQVMEKAMRWAQVQRNGVVAKLANVKLCADAIVADVSGSYARQILTGV